MLICSRCGKVIANTQPELHYGICAGCGVNANGHTLANYVKDRQRELEMTIDVLKKKHKRGTN